MFLGKNHTTTKSRKNNLYRKGMKNSHGSQMRGFMQTDRHKKESAAFDAGHHTAKRKQRKEGKMKLSAAD